MGDRAKVRVDVSHYYAINGTLMPHAIIDLLTGRLEAATTWLRENAQTTNLRIGYFGASTGVVPAASEIGLSNIRLRAKKLDHRFGCAIDNRTFLFILMKASRISLSLLTAGILVFSLASSPALAKGKEGKGKETKKICNEMHKNFHKESNARHKQWHKEHKNRDAEWKTMHKEYHKLWIKEHKDLHQRMKRKECGPGATSSVSSSSTSESSASTSESSTSSSTSSSSSVSSVEESSSTSSEMSSESSAQ
jgi:hypothetical protein